MNDITEKTNDRPTHLSSRRRSCSKSRLLSIAVRAVGRFVPRYSIWDLTISVTVRALCVGWLLIGW